MKTLLLIGAVVFLSGCSIFSAKTTVQTPTGEKYVVTSKRNATVEYYRVAESGATESIKVDNKGNISGFELILPTVLNAGKDIKVED